MVKVFYSPPGCRETTGILFKEAAKGSSYPDYSDILYLAPTSIKADDARKTFHKIQNNKCYIPPEINTISGYCKKLYSLSGDKKMLPGPLATVMLSGLSGKGLGFSSFTADFINDLKRHYPFKDADYMKHFFTNVFHEMNIPEPVADVVTGVLEIFGKYQAALNENGLADDDDVINWTAAAFMRGEWFDGESGFRTLILDGFYDPDPAEKNILDALIRHSENACIAVPHAPGFFGITDKYIRFLKENFIAEETKLKPSATGYAQAAGKPFVYYSYPGIEEEVEGIARNIKSLYVSGKLKELDEVAVVFPDLNSYAPMSERVFRRYGIPHEISAGKKLGRVRPFLDLMSLLGSVAEGYPRLKFSQFLSSKYFKNVPESLRQWIPHISLHSGIISGKNAWLSFVSEGSETLDVMLIKERDALKSDLGRIFKKLEPLEKIGSGAGLCVYADTLKKILAELGFQGHLDGGTEDPGGERSDGSQAGIDEAIDGIIEQVHFLGSLNPVPVTMSEFKDVLNYLLNALYLEPKGSGVRILDFSHALGLTPDYLYFGGLVDGDMPEKQDMDYILPDNVKQKMGFMHLDKFNDVQKFAFNSIINSCKHLHLSYPLMDGDTLFLPSSFLYTGEEMRGNVPGVFSAEEYLVRSGKAALLDNITEIRVPPFLLRISSRFNVTDIDAYRACPRRFFIEKKLKLVPPAVKEYEIEAATVGTIIHRIMERLVLEPFSDFGYLKEKAGRIIDDVLKNKKLDAYWHMLIKDTFIEMLPSIYEKELEIREDGYVSTEVEKSVSGEPVSGISLKGKIDRIDIIEDAVQIIDYKTGTAGLNCAGILKGRENLQLFLYAALLRNDGYNIKRVGIYSLKDMDIKWCPPKKKKGRKASASGECADSSGVNDYIGASVEFMKDAAAGMMKGDFAAKPLNDYTCWNCHEYAFCPYIQQ